MSDVNEEVVGAPDIKRIQTEIEGITNELYGNQFIAYFLKIPQIGHYQVPETKSLRPHMMDRVNETITGTTLPDVINPTVPIAYFAHQNAHYPGVGDGELGTITLEMMVDRFLNNYTFMLNWSYMKYDYTSGGLNCKEGITKEDLVGKFVVAFIDSEENISRKITYSVLIESVPGLPLNVTTPDNLKASITLRVVDMDLSKFIEGQVLSHNPRLS